MMKVCYWHYYKILAILPFTGWSKLVRLGSKAAGESSYWKILDVYKRQVTDKADRSYMNICFVMNDEYKELEADFMKFATERGMVGIKGHRSVCLLYTSRCV